MTGEVEHSAAIKINKESYKKSKVNTSKLCKHTYGIKVVFRNLRKSCWVFRSAEYCKFQEVTHSTSEKKANKFNFLNMDLA